MLFALGATAFAVALAAAPVAESWFAVPVYAFGALVCHQLPDRSFHLGGAQLPVCARCFGIYTGAAAAAVLAWREPGTSRRLAGAGRIARALLIAAAVPTVLTLLVEWSGIGRPSNVVRALTGAPLGGALALVLAGAMATLHYDRCVRPRPVRSTRQPPPI